MRMAYRTEDYDGVRDFARGCMRTDLIFKEKGKRWNHHPEIQEILGEIEGANKGGNGLGKFSAGKSTRLLSKAFDRREIASKDLSTSVWIN